MTAFASLAILTALLFSPVLTVTQQTESKPATGSISGRVTIGAEPAAGVMVALQPEVYSLEALSKAVTDTEGRFRLLDVPAGRYRVVPTAPLFLMPSEIPGDLPGKLVTVKAGEAVEELEFRLTRGGVITGRVTDAKGQPVIEERVNVTLLDERGSRRPFFNSNSTLLLNQTDDRGIYRIFGLPPGRYIVSAGTGNLGSQFRFTTGPAQRPRIYHPDATDQAKATIVEVTANGETSNVDIRFPVPPQFYAVTGRIVDAETNQPLPDLNFSVGLVQREGSAPVSSASFLRSDQQGNFHVEGVTPGRYGVFLDPGRSGFYSETVIFEVSDHDLTDLTIMAQRGVSVTGAVVLQGSPSPALRSALAQLRVSASSHESGASPSITYWANIQPDGSFQFPNMRPGKLSLGLTANDYTRSKGFSLLRIEGAKMDRFESLEITPEQPVTGIRMIVAYGTGVVSGQLKIIGTLPQGLRLSPSIRFNDQSSQRSVARAEVDAQGRFVFDGLPTGAHQITWSLMGIPTASLDRDLMTRILARVRQMNQTITVNDGAETQITATLDLSEKEKNQ
jgi:hypothetical protein